MREGYEDLFSKHEPDRLLRELNGNVLWQYVPMNPNDERKPVSSVAPFHAAAEINRLRAENERLREALRYYAKNHYPDIDAGPWGLNSADFGDVARAALGEEN